MWKASVEYTPIQPQKDWKEHDEQDSQVSAHIISNTKKVSQSIAGSCNGFFMA